MVKSWRGGDGGWGWGWMRGWRESRLDRSKYLIWFASEFSFVSTVFTATKSALAIGSEIMASGEWTLSEGWWRGGAPIPERHPNDFYREKCVDFFSI